MANLYCNAFGSGEFKILKAGQTYYVKLVNSQTDNTDNPAVAIPGKIVDHTVYSTKANEDLWDGHSTNLTLDTVYTAKLGYHYWDEGSTYGFKTGSSEFYTISISGISAKYACIWAEIFPLNADGTVSSTHILSPAGDKGIWASYSWSNSITFQLSKNTLYKLSLWGGNNSGSLSDNYTCKVLITSN
jgi:hypothetical protein